MSQPHEKIYKSRKQIFFDNFVGGIGWAIGATLGGSILLAIIALILKQINLIPIVGTFVIEVTKFINTH